MDLPVALALLSAGRSILTRIAIMAIAMSSSNNVNLFFIVILAFILNVRSCFNKESHSSAIRGVADAYDDFFSNGFLLSQISDDSYFIWKAVCCHKFTELSQYHREKESSL